jgi:hypothetical protein
MTESPRYGAVGIASADPTSSVVRAAIEATEATRIKVLQLNLVFDFKKRWVIRIVPVIVQVLELDHNLADMLVYKTSITTREQHYAHLANRARDKILRCLWLGSSHRWPGTRHGKRFGERAYCAATPTLSSR